MSSASDRALKVRIVDQESVSSSNSEYNPSPTNIFQIINSQYRLCITAIDTDRSPNFRLTQIEMSEFWKI